MCIWSDDFKTTSLFISGVLKLEPCISNLKAFGTDGEIALVNALETCFPNAIGLRRFIHKAGSIEEHLKGVSNSIKMEIMRDILGAHEGENF